MSDALSTEAHEAGMAMSLNCALICMGREARGLVLERIAREDPAADQVGIIMRSIGGMPTRMFAIVQFRADALQLPLDIWPRPSASPRLSLVKGEGG